MPCQCGKITVPTKKAAPIKVPPRKATGHSSHAGAAAKASAASQKAKAIATKAANAKSNPYAKGCKCH